MHQASAMGAPSKHSSRVHAVTPTPVDEIWGRVIEVFADREFLVELTHVRTEEEDEYDEQERVIGDRGSVELGDYVHVWVRERDNEGCLHGRMLVEDEDAEDFDEEEAEEDDDEDEEEVGEEEEYDEDEDEDEEDGD